MILLDANEEMHCLVTRYFWTYNVSEGEWIWGYILRNEEMRYA